MVPYIGIVGDDDYRAAAVLAGGGDFVAHHQRAAVTHKRDDLFAGAAQAARDRHRHAGAHGADDRRQKLLTGLEADYRCTNEPKLPASEVITASSARCLSTSQTMAAKLMPSVVGSQVPFQERQMDRV